MVETPQNRTKSAGCFLDNGPLISIVVPVYNMEKYLPACLDSVTDELVSDRLEVIVVNDGSTDGSLDIIRRYEQKRPDLIKVIDKGVFAEVGDL